MRKIHVTLNVDEETILKESDQENLDDAISQELGWLHDSGISVENWSYADPEKEREGQLINNILNYLADHYDESELYQMLHDELEMSHEEIGLLGFDLPDCYKEQPSMQTAHIEHNQNKWFLEVVQCQDGTYYANMAVARNFVRGLPEYVDYNTLRRAIRLKTGISILPKKDMIFQKSGTRNYAYIDATQPREDCRVTLEEMKNGWKPGWSNTHDIIPKKQYMEFDDMSAPKSEFFWLDNATFVNSFGPFFDPENDEFRVDCEYHTDDDTWHMVQVYDEQVIPIDMAELPAEQRTRIMNRMIHEGNLSLPKPMLSDQIQSASSRTSNSQSHTELQQPGHQK